MTQINKVCLHLRNIKNVSDITFFFTVASRLANQLIGKQTGCKLCDLV